MAPDDSSARPSSSLAGSAGGVWQPPSPEELKDYFPQYEIVALLGRGGMGAVYKGWQRSLDRFVAIKILPPGMDDADVNYSERFKQEAKSMAKLMHPGIVAVFDAGETPSGLLYFVMEFVEGTDVAHMVQSQGKLPPEHALAITAHVCDALQYAHTHGIIHRDIKPANIMVNMEGAVKVADFGLAKHNDPGVSGLTKTNMAMGTPDYVAPEALIEGVTVDGRADIYAVGVMLYQMLTGNIPRGMFTMPSAMVKTDPRFDMIIAKAMQTDRDQRYASAAMLRRDLDVILTVPLVKAGDTQTSAAIPKQSLPQKPVAKGPQKPQGQPAPAAKPNLKSPVSDSKSKSSAGLYLGIAAAVAVLSALAFLFSGKKPAVETDAAAAETATKPAPPITIKEAATSKPPVTKTPVPRPAATGTAAGSTPASTNTEGWVDALAEWWATSPGASKGLLAKEPGGSRIVNGSQGFFIGNHRDFAVRATVKGVGRGSSWHLGLRAPLKVADIGYRVSLADKDRPSTLRVTSAAGTRTLQEFAIPPGFSITDRHTMEFRAQGDLLTVLLDGQQVAQVRDSTVMEKGRGYVSSEKGALIEKFEYRELSGTVPDAAPALATAANGELWKDGLAEWLADTKVNRSGFANDPGGWRVIGSRSSIFCGLRHRSLAIRATTQAGAAKYWRIGLGNSTGVELHVEIGKAGGRFLRRENNNERTLIASFDLPPGFVHGDRHVTEVRSQGGVLICFLDGTEVARTNAAHTSSGGWFSADVGALIEKLEYRELPGTAPATPAAVSDEQWVDALAEWWAQSPDVGKGLLAKEAGGSRVVNDSIGVFTGKGRDIAVRATAQGIKGSSWRLSVRSKGTTRYFAALIAPTQQTKLYSSVSGKGTILQEAPLPTGFSITDRHTFELRAQGDLITLLLDGQQVAQVRDSSVKESGQVYFSGTNGTLIEKFEYRELPPAVTSVTSEPAKAPAVIAISPPAAPATVDTALWTDAIALLPLVDLEKDTVKAGWTREGGDLVSGSKHQPALVELPVIPPEEYDLRLRFTKKEQQENIFVVLSRGEHSILWSGGVGQNTIFGFGHYRGGSSLKSLTTANPSLKTVNSCFEAGRAYTVQIAVRKTGVTAYLDGAKVSALPADLAEMQTPEAFKVRTAGALGIGTFKTSYAVHAIELREITGKVKYLREPPAADPVAQRLAQLEQQFLAAYDKQAGAAHKAAVADLNTKFTAALDRSIATVSKAGKLDEALALRNEKSLIQTSGAVPAEDAADTPETLKALRKTYRDTMTTLIATRDKNAAPLHAAYDKTLAAYQDELTIAQKLDEAARVKAVRDKLSSGVRQDSNDVRTPPPTPSAPAPKSIAPPKAAVSGSSWRRAAEWVLAKGGRVTIDTDTGKGRKTITDLADLPSGRFDVLEVFLDMEKNPSAATPTLDEEMSALSGLKDVTRLTLANMPITGTGLVHLSAMKDLTLLNLNGTNVTDVSLASISGLTKLTELSLRGTAITDSGIPHLAPLTKLTKLDLSARGLTGTTLGALAGCKDLVELILGDYRSAETRMTDDSLRILAAAALPKLEKLAIHSGTPTDAGMAHLAGMKLKELSLNLFPITGAGLKNIVQITTLERLQFGGTPFTDADITVLPQLKSLTSLSLYSWEITDASLRVFEGMPALRRLDWSKSKVTPEGREALLKARPNLKL